MNVISDTSDNPSAFTKLIDDANCNGWCTRPFCTTCGSQDFRVRLSKIPREEVIAGLRQLSSDFLSEYSDMFRLVILEISLFGIGGELLDLLEGTPAWVQLRADIDNQDRNY